MYSFSNGQNFINQSDGDVRYEAKLLHNTTAVVAPGVSNDSSEGYSVRSLWIDTVIGNVYICLDNSVGAAVWQDTTLTLTDLGALALGDDASDVPYPATHIIGSQTDLTNSLQFINHMWSAGVSHGCDLTDNGDGTVAISAGNAMLRTSASETADMVVCVIPAIDPVSLTDNSINYIYVDYNAGTPQIAVGTSVTDFNCLNKCIAYTVVREGTQLYWVDARFQNVDANRKHRRVLLEAEPFRHVIGGCALAATGTRNITITAGSFYYGLAKISHDTFDTSIADTFIYYYTTDNGATWTKTTGNTQIDNLQYNNPASGLVTLSNNKFGVHWVYLILDNPTVIAIQYGQGDYASLAEAQASSAPTAPPAIAGIGALIGRIIIEKSGASFSAVESAFAHQFVQGAATNHNNLAGLQGGTLGEYYHMTSAEYAAVPFGGHSGTATAVAGAATLNAISGKITSESLSTAAGSDYILTLTNSQVAATDLVFASIANGTNTGGEPLVEIVQPGSGSISFEIHNNSTLTAFNGTVVVSFMIIKA